MIDQLAVDESAYRSFSVFEIGQHGTDVGLLKRKIGALSHAPNDDRLTIPNRGHHPGVFLG